MRLISYRPSGGGEALGVTARERWMAAELLLPGGPKTMQALLDAGPASLDELRAASDIERITIEGQPMDGLELLAPVTRPRKVVAIGRNYREHVDEEGAEAPAAPVIFAKWSSAIIGPGAEIRWDPAFTSQVDYEAELAVVIGRTARRIGQAEALEHVMGYTCLNDVSARDLQFGDGQWVRGKSLDTFCPMGPVLVTADEITDPQNLEIECRIGDRVVQQSNTSQMFFGVAAIVSYCSWAFTLDPGDVIATGTPGGVGIFRSPPLLLADGDEVSVEISRIGRLVNTCRLESIGTTV